MRGIIEEVLRWAPQGLTSMPHRLQRHEKFEGYELEKDTVLILNI